MNAVNECKAMNASNECKQTYQIEQVNVFVNFQLIILLLAFLAYATVPTETWMYPTIQIRLQWPSDATSDVSTITKAIEKEKPCSKAMEKITPLTQSTCQSRPLNQI